MAGKQRYSQGERFGKLTLIRMEQRKGPKSERLRSGWVVSCDCGSESWQEVRNLATGNTTQCWECAKTTRAAKKISHGALAKSADAGVNRLYAVWKTMRARCNNPSSLSYPRYGGRGISVCSRWDESFDAFLSDMGIPGPGMSIDRIDVDGMYGPENCKWSSRKEQGNNKTNNVRHEIDGEMMTIGEAAERYCLGYDFIKARMKRGFTMKDAVTMPKNMRRKGYFYRVDGQEFATLQQVATTFDLAVSSVASRFASDSFGTWTREVRRNG